MAGKIVPNYLSNFPPTYIQQAINVDFGVIRADSSSPWAKYYNYPETGINLFFSNFGENKIFGNQISVLPYVSFNVLKKSKTPWNLKLGLGGSYFTTHYDSIKNPRDLAIGSSFSWAFQIFLYKTIYQRNGFNLRISGGYSHASNGHTQLPNLGINSGLIGLSAQFYKKQEEDFSIPVKGKIESSKTSTIFGIEEGVGFHEFGHRDYPVGGDKYLVQSTSVFFGKELKNHHLVKVGLTHRYYESYHDYIVSNNDHEYLDQPKLNSSAIELFAGSEFYMGHISMDVYLGVDIFKPFYKRFGQLFKERTEIEYQLKRIFATRLGLNLYLINTSNNPKHNIYIGPHIKANVDQADFTEIVIGYHYRIN